MGTLRVHSFESFGTLDGPGVRLVVFLQGCPLRCIFCHNPDTWNQHGGQEIEINEIVRKACRMQPYFDDGVGGVTFSGGEPLMQAIPLFEAINALHEKKIHVAIDTSGAIATPETFKVLDAADLILLDVKSPFPEKFEKVTGQKIDSTMEVFNHLKKTQKAVWIRQVVAQGLNDTTEEKNATELLIKGLNVQRFDILPYHELGIHKYETLGIPYAGKDLKPFKNH